MARAITYPFVPKSTASLVAGQFWSIELSDGTFACGRVLDADHAKERRLFVGGLLDWHGRELPSEAGIAGASLLDFGQMHVKCIVQCGGAVLGMRPLNADGIEVPHSKSAACGPCTVRRGLSTVRMATAEDIEELPALRTWGLLVPRIRAESRFIDDGVRRT